MNESPENIVKAIDKNPRVLVSGSELSCGGGVIVQKLSNGFVRVRVHYSAIKNRRGPEWAEAAAAKYGGTRSYKWRREMEIDESAASGEPVFPTWDPLVHTCEPFPIPRNWPKWLLYDIGGVNPHALLWVAMDPKAPDYTLYAYREWYKGLDMPDGSQGAYFTVSDVTRIAYELSLDPGGGRERYEAFVVDPQARASQARAGEKMNVPALTIFDEIAQNIDTLGWPVELHPGNNLKDQAIDDLTERLGNYPLYEEDGYGNVIADEEGHPVPQTYENGLPLIVQPRFFVFPGCRWLSWEMGVYRWAEWASDKVGETRNRPEAPVDKNDHQMTNVVRLMNWIRRDPSLAAVANTPPPPRPADPGSEAARQWRKRRRKDDRG